MVSIQQLLHQPSFQSQGVSTLSWTHARWPLLPTDHKWGVIGVQYRAVPCTYKPPKPAPALANPTPGGFSFRAMAVARYQQRAPRRRPLAF